MAVNKTGWVEFVCKIILFSENNSLKVGKKVSKREKLYIFMLNSYYHVMLIQKNMQFFPVLYIM